MLPFAGTVRLFRRAGSAALDRIGHGAGGLDQAEQEQRFQGVSEHGSALQLECFAHGHEGVGFPLSYTTCQYFGGRRDGSCFAQKERGRQSQRPSSR
ncbi:hypothetical protein AI22_08605 [Pseudomonas aeruginosa YL84]|nr:hypothetical protein AI22_08605 [Pseudomonas aeruginosa YL84]